MSTQCDHVDILHVPEFVFTLRTCIYLNLVKVMHTNFFIFKIEIFFLLIIHVIVCHVHTTNRTHSSFYSIEWNTSLAISDRLPFLVDLIK